MARLALAFVAALLVAAAPAAALTAQELVGTWHVVAHFKDSAAENKDAKRWEDRVWVFKLEGGRLRWSEYPIVVFQSEVGRFEETESMRAARVLDYWEPNAAQLAEIKAGPRVNSRGTKSKSLRGSDAKGWSSSSGAGGFASASVITYEEVWSLTGLPDKPRFERLDIMGAASTDSFEGKTVYATTSAEDGGDLLRGDFNRDGTRVGSFQARRGGAPRGLESKYESDGERAYEYIFGEGGRALFQSTKQHAIDEPALRKKIAAKKFSDTDRKDLTWNIEQEIAELYEKNGRSRDKFRREIESLARKMVVLFVDDGRSLEDIRQAVASGALKP